MRHYQYTQLAVLQFLVVFNSLSYAQEPIAAIVNVHGQVSIKAKPNAPWKPSGTKIKLCEGYLVKTEKASRATILYFNGQEIRVDPQQTHRVTMKKAKKPANARISRALKSWLKKKEPLPAGVRRETDTPPVLLYPRYGKILSSRPSFAWLSSAFGATYWIRIISDSSRLVWSATSKDTSLQYSAGASGLPDGRSYRVEIGRVSLEKVEDYGVFVVVPAAERKNIAALQQEIQTRYQSEEPDNLTAPIVYAALLMHEEFFTEALLILRQALEKHPDHSTLRNMLAQLYDQVGPRPPIDDLLKL